MPDSREQFSDLVFPVNGIDLSAGFQRQRSGTTRVGSNVRAFEVLTQRMRGGSRAGLSKYIPTTVTGAVGSTPGLIQNLNTVVDPQAQALLANYNFPPPVEADPSSIFFPDGSRRIAPGQNIPVGGTGATPYSTVPMSPGSVTPSKIKFVQATHTQVTGPGGFGFSSMTTSGNLVVLCVVNMNEPLTITDSDSNTYSTGPSITSGNIVGTATLTIYYTFATATDFLSFSYSPPNDIQGGIVALEYSGVKASGPIDSTGTNSGSGTSASSGSIAVGASGEMLLAAFLNVPTVDPGSGSPPTPSGSAVLRDFVSMTFGPYPDLGNGAAILSVFDIIGVNSAASIATTLADISAWSTAAASIKSA